MRMNTLVRVGGWAAILAGVLRAAGSFVSGGSEVERQSLYFIVDLLLLLGVFAAYAQNHEALGRWGAAGFLTTVAGILLVRSSRAVPGLDLYPAGALSVAIGWVLSASIGGGRRTARRSCRSVCSVCLDRPRRSDRQHLAALFVASGVIFGAAMVGVGRQILLAATEARRNEARGSSPESAR